LRVTIGMRTENQRFLKALEEVLAEGQGGSGPT